MWLSTQAFKESSIQEVKYKLHPFQQDSKPGPGFTTVKSPEQSSTWKYGRIHLQPDNLKSQSISVIDTCSSCQSFAHDKPAIISNDSECETSFISSQYPLQEELYAIVRQAGIRSLSCEVYPEKEGAIYYGDEARGHVISFTFFVKDFQARGFQRRYSIIVLMRDKIFLLNSWSFLLSQIQEIIVELQDCASKVYKLEEGKSSQVRINIADNNIKRHRLAGNPRSLTELVGKTSIWKELHSQFSWILKAAAMRLHEGLTEGSDIVIPSVEEGCMQPATILSLIGPVVLQKLLHSLYIGRKIILKSSDISFLSKIVESFKFLMPSYLFQPSPFTSDGFRVNILIASNDAITPPFLTLTFHERKCEHFDELLYDVEVFDPEPLTLKPPQIVSKILKLIENESLPKAVINLSLATLINDWNFKVKVWSYLKKCSYNASSFSGCSTPCLSTGKPITKHNMLLSVSALDCDLPALDTLVEYYDKVTDR